MRLRSPLVIAYFYLLSSYTQRTVSFKTSPGMRRFLFTSTTSTAASASVPPTSSVASTTSAVAGASSAVVQSSSVIKEDEGPSAKRARVEVVSTASIASNPSTSYHVLGKHFNMLSSTQQQLAHNCPDNIWVEYPGIMLKLRSSKEKKEAKGVIAFDMDGTIIATKSGKTFAENEFDWKFWNEAVLSKLRALHEEGYFLAFISNQGGVGKKKDNVDGKAALQRKVDAIIDRVNVPIDFICSFENDIFRKPRTGMWDFLSIARWQASVEASKSSEETSSSFRLLYVGDAAGRPSHGTRSKDFSDTDLKVALNLGVEFNTPEKFFLQINQRLHTEVYENVASSIRLAHMPSVNVAYPEEIFHKLGEQEVVLLVAPPASGKTTLSTRFQELGYVRVNQDESGSLKTCIQQGKDALAQGKSVVVDNTNLNVATRATWLEIARLHNVKCRCVVIDIPKDICMLLSTLRLIDPRTPAHDRRKIETVVFHKYFKEMKLPSEQENFDLISKVSWSPTLPCAQEHAVSHRLYHMYLK